MNEKRNALAIVLTWLRQILVLPIRLYQKLISPIIGSRCIYTPTCSEYSKNAVLRHGVRGLLLGAARLLRCVGGLYRGGDDPVPEQFTFRHLFGSYRKFWRGRGA